MGDVAASALASTVSKCVQQLADLDASQPGARGVIHGDFHPGNVIISPAGPVFIDWADAAYGALVWDQATFEASSGKLAYSNAGLSARLSVLAGLKEITDFLSTPLPMYDQKYAVSIPR
ncbi:MAG: aminoglycoside phosphotransferase family protein, partial [Pseudonocardiaceae bacterium]